MNEREKRFWRQLACLWVFLFVLVAAPFLADVLGQGVVVKHFTITVSGSTSLTWTLIQESNVIFCSQLGSISSCNIGAAQIAPTTAGSVWILQIQEPNNVTIQSVTGGGGTWTHCPNCHAKSTNSLNVDASYNLSGNAGTTQGIVVTLTGPSGGNGIAINFVEIMPPAGNTASFDDSGSSAPAACLVCTGVTLSSITATDFIWENPGGGSKVDWTSVAAPWVLHANGGQFNLNTTSGTAPTVTFEATNNALCSNMVCPAFLAIAFKSSAGIFGPPSYQSQNSIVQFDSFTATCNPICTRTLPQATGTGNLLFVMAADLNNDSIASISGSGWNIPSGANTCKIAYVQAGNNAFSCGYVLSSTAGVTSLSITMSGNTSTGFGIWEIASNTGFPWAFDVQGSQVNVAGASNPGTALNIAGKNDIIFQGIFAPGGASSGGTYYPLTYIAHAGVGYILFNEASESVLLNSGPTAPTPIWVNPQTTQNTAAFGIAFTAAGKTYTAADCTYASVSALESIAVNGDTVILPACSQTNWATRLIINTCSELKGQGQGVTTVGDNVPKGNGQDYNMILMSLNCPSPLLARLHDFSLVGVSTDPGNNNKGHIRISGSGTTPQGGFRVYNITGTNMQSSLVAADYVGPGLFDHLSLPGQCGAKGEINLKASSWGGAQNGNGSWSDSTVISLAPGITNQIYIEDSSWTCGAGAPTQVADGDAGARWVFRFNTVAGGNTGNHGSETSGAERSARWNEVYKNVYTFPVGDGSCNGSPAGGQCPAFGHWYRGGSGEVWGNQFTAPNSLQTVARGLMCRDNPGTICGTLSGTIWGVATGSNPYDQNSTGSGYRTVDQMGAGTSNVISCASPPCNTASTPTPVAWVGNALRPVYVWLNIVNGSLDDVGTVGQLSASVALNRDVYRGHLSPAVGNGTVGVGVGTKAQMLAITTCTDNVGFWVTDEGFWNTKTVGVADGQRYKCSSNAWVLDYTPHTYPHPYQSL